MWGAGTLRLPAGRPEWKVGSADTEQGAHGRLVDFCGVSVLIYNEMYLQWTMKIQRRREQLAGLPTSSRVPGQNRRRERPPWRPSRRLAMLCAERYFLPNSVTCQVLIRSPSSLFTVSLSSPCRKRAELAAGSLEDFCLADLTRSPRPALGCSAHHGPPDGVGAGVSLGPEQSLLSRFGHSSASWF